MRSLILAVIIAGGTFAGVVAAGASSPSSVSLVKGTAFVMRGNGVKELSAGAEVRGGDRILTTSGSAARLSDGKVVGSLTLASFDVDTHDMKSVSGDRSDNKSGSSRDKFSSGLFDIADHKSGYKDDDKDDRGGKGGKDKDDHDGKGGKYKDDHDNDHDHSWKGVPEKTPACSG